MASRIPSDMSGLQVHHKDPEALREMLQLRSQDLMPQANRIGNPNFDPATVQRDAQETHIVVHAEYPQLVEAFLAHKRQYGSSVEKGLYNSENWAWEKQVARLGEHLLAASPFLHLMLHKKTRAVTNAA
jgi:hypothetical protein